MFSLSVATLKRKKYIILFERINRQEESSKRGTVIPQRLRYIISHVKLQI